MARKGSAAWVLVIVIILAFIMGALVFTAVDPALQALFGSSIWSANTAEGQNLLSWQKAAWAFLPAAVLLGLLLNIYIDTRQPS